MLPNTPSQSPQPPSRRFVAYVYPGWHRDDFRPDVDEWSLLDRFEPYFEGHHAPPEPSAGRYDDTEPSTCRRQVDEASHAGIAGFSYFAYYGPDGFVMQRPMDLAFQAAEQTHGRFSVMATWCVRLPHHCFPVSHTDGLEIPEPSAGQPEPLDSRPLESLTLADLEELLGADDPAWETEVFLGWDPFRRRLESMRTAGADTTRNGADPQ